jgi:hypothetical protein
MASIEADKTAGSTLPVIRSRAPAISISIVPLLDAAAAIGASPDNATAAKSASEASRWHHLAPPPKQLARMEPSRAPPPMHRRSHQPLLLFGRPPSPALHRRDHLDPLTRHRTIPRKAP